MRATHRLWHNKKPIPYTTAKNIIKYPGTTVTMVRHQPHTSSRKRKGGRPKEK